MWLQSSTGAINLDNVVMTETTGTPGSLGLYASGLANPVAVVSLGSTDSEAIANFRKLTRAVAPADI